MRVLRRVGVAGGLSSSEDDISMTSKSTKLIGSTGTSKGHSRLVFSTSRELPAERSTPFPLLVDVEIGSGPTLGLLAGCTTGLSTGSFSGHIGLSEGTLLSAVTSR